MGCFNSVMFTCLRCNEKIEAQSKAGSCAMKTFDAKKVPMPEAEDLFGDEVYCEKCKMTYIIEGNYPRYATLFLIDKPKEDENDF